MRRLSHGKQRSGHHNVCLKTHDGKRHMQRMHVLICISFNGERPPGMQCSHLNDIKMVYTV